MSTQQIRSGIADTFVARPVLAIVLNLLTAFAGFAALNGVEAREMPDVDQPVLSVTVTWDGTALETVDAEDTAVIEDVLGQLDVMKSVSASSSYGHSRLTIDLNDGTDINIAASEVSEILTRTEERQLPEGIDDPTVTKNDSDAAPIIRLALMGDASMKDLTDMAESLITERLSSFAGMAEVQVAGAQANEFPIGVPLPSLATTSHC
tara:strand:- start:2220 stop:2840 length:621 start_codon:yes stop_codon:yes gene_type:complete